MAQEKEDGEENKERREEERRRRVGNAQRPDAFFPWSRALTNPLRCNCLRHRDSRGREVPWVVL